MKKTYLKLYTSNEVNFEHNGLGILKDAINYTVTEERNGDFTLKFDYPVGSRLSTELIGGNIVKANANDDLKGQLFKIWSTSKSEKGIISVFARHISFDLATDYIKDVTISNQSCEYVLNQLFRNSQKSKHYKGYSDIQMLSSYSMQRSKLLECIAGKQGSIIDTFGNGADILRDNTNIHVLQRRGKDRNVLVAYKKNIKGFKLEDNFDDMITRAYVFATYTNDDQEEVIVEAPNGGFVDSPRIYNYKDIYIDEFDFSDKFDSDNLPTPVKLLELADAKYKESKCDIPKLTYTINFVALSSVEGNEELKNLDNIGMGDKVLIRNSMYNIVDEARVVKTVYDPVLNNYKSIELGEPKTTLGDLIGSSNNEPIVGPQGPQGPPGADGDIESFPDTLPSIPIIKGESYFGSISLSWTFEDKVYYTYEVYASQIKGFNPNAFDLVFKGQASSYLHNAEPNQTWYFRVRAVNTHGNATNLSDELEVSTFKISDSTQYFAEAAIKDATIGELRLDRGWVGQLKGNHIDAKLLTVTDGNNKRRLHIDDFGRVYLNPTQLLIEASTETNLASKSEVSDALDISTSYTDNKIKDINDSFNEVNENIFDLNDYIDNAFKDGVLTDSEIITLKSKIDTINQDRVKIADEYTNILSNEHFVDDNYKNILSDLKDKYDDSYANLIDSIKNASENIINKDKLDFIKVKDNVFSRVFHKKKLAGTTVAQSFDIDFKNKNIYVAQVRNAAPGNIRVNRLDFSGNVLDYMIINNSGHGANIAFDEGYIWTEADPYTSSAGNGYGTKIGRVKYTADATIDMNTCEHYDPLPEHINLFQTLDGNIICVRSLLNKTDYYTTYNFADFKKGIFNPITQFSVPSVETSWQGFSLLDNIIYVYEGQAEKLMSRKVHAFKTTGEKLYEDNVNITDTLVFGEPEGVKVFKNNDITTMYIGFADGESGARNYSMYSINKIRTDYNALIDDALNIYTNNLSALKQALVEAINLIGDYKSYLAITKSNEYIEKKSAEFKLTTDAITQSVSSLKTSTEFQYGDISRLRIKSNHTNINTPNDGEIYLYGVDEKGSTISKGNPIRVVLQGKLLQFNANHLNPHHSDGAYSCPLNKIIYIVFANSASKVFGVWADSESSTGWKAINILGDSIINEKITNFTWREYHCIIGDFTLTANELVSSCNLYKQATDSSLIKQIASRTELKQTADSINLEVKKKIGKNEVVSSINQTSETIKIKANKIQLEGATSIGNASSDRVLINNADYEIINGSTTKGFFGLRELDDNRLIPRFAMGHAGLDKFKHNYLVMQTYPKDNNPQNYAYPYLDIGYRCNKFTNSSGYGDVSNIKIYGDGDIRVAPIRKTELTTNYVNGAYGGEGERVVAEFGSSSSQYYDLFMGVRAIRNNFTTNGLILAHYNANESACLVRVNCDSNGDRFFRPLTADGNVALGSGGFPWKSVHSKSTYSSQGVVARDIEVRAVNNDDILDNIEFIDNYTKDVNNELVIDVTKVKNTHYVNEEEGNIYINESEMIKLLLKEVKELKDKVKNLESKVS